MRSKPVVVLLSFLLLAAPLSPVLGSRQVQINEQRASKLDGALRLLQQMAPQGVWRRAARDRLAMSRTLEVDLSRPDPTVTVLAQVRNGRIEQLHRAGFHIQVQIGDVVTTTVPIARLDELVALPEVVRVDASRIRELMLDRSIPEIRADKIRTRNPDGTFSGRTGRGVVVGVIDDGIDWKHPDFQTPQGRTRIKFLWDVFDDTFQKSEGTIGLAPPIKDMDGMPRGTVYIEAQINAALDKIAEGEAPEVFTGDPDGHGSDVAGIAAGNGRGAGGTVPAGTFVGVAPEADLIIVRAAFVGAITGVADSDVIAGLSYINDRAAAIGEPWVTNLSLGNHFGPHDGTTLQERAINNLVGPGKSGKAIVIAAGNNGDTPIHTGPRGFTYEPPVLAPGTNDPRTGTPFVNFGPVGEPVLNGSLAASDPGAVVFRANFVAPTSPPDFDGIFVAAGSRVTPVARIGNPAPFTSGGLFGRSFQRPPSINALGDIAFDARFTDPGTPSLNKWGIFFASGALSSDPTITFQRIAVQGQPAPGFTPSSGRTLFFGLDRPPFSVNQTFSLARINDRREVAFTAQIQDPAGGLTSAIFIASATSRARLGMVGDPASGTGGGTFAGFQRPVSLNNNGTVAFAASITRGSGGQGIFTVNEGTAPALRILTGDIATGTDGGSFASFGVPMINDLGAIVFIGRVTGSRAAPPVSQGVFLALPGGLPIPLALSGDPSPDHPFSSVRFKPPPPLQDTDLAFQGTFAEFLGIPAINNAGFVSFRARVARGTVRQGIFLVLPIEHLRRIVPVAMSGSAVGGSGDVDLRFRPPAPGTNEGEDFNQFGNPVMNPASPNGALTFGASLQNGKSGDGIFVASLIAGKLTPGKPLVIHAFGARVGRSGRFDFWLNRQDDFTMTIYGGVRAGDPRAPFLLTAVGSNTGPNGNLDETTGIVLTNGGNVNGDREVSFSTFREGHFIITLTPVGIRSEGRVDGWETTGNATFVGMSDDRTHLVGIPGTAAEAITVGAYVSKVAYVDSMGRDQNEDTTRVDLSGGIGSLAPFSSPGPTRDTRPKPEITAPGAFIGSTRSRDAIPALPSSDPKFFLPDGMHRISAGTSLAAPHVTGAVAIMLEKNPVLDASQIKKILMTTARQDSFTNMLPQRALKPIPDPAERMPQIFWGAGKLDVQAALAATP